MGQACFSRSNFGKFIKYLIEILHYCKENYVQHLLTPPKAAVIHHFWRGRTKSSSECTETVRFAIGHTHRPFVSPTQNLVNTGSWVKDEETFNTYAELNGKNIQIMRYSRGNITDIY